MATLEKRLKCCKFSGRVTPTPTPTPTTAKISIAIDWQEAFQYDNVPERTYPLGDNSITDIQLFACDSSTFDYTVSNKSVSITGDGYIDKLKFDVEVDLSSLVFSNDAKELGFINANDIILTTSTGDTIAPVGCTNLYCPREKSGNLLTIYPDGTLESCWEA